MLHENICYIMSETCLILQAIDGNDHCFVPHSLPLPLLRNLTWSSCVNRVRQRYKLGGNLTACMKFPSVVLWVGATDKPGITNNYQYLHNVQWNRFMIICMEPTENGQLRPKKKLTLLYRPTYKYRISYAVIYLTTTTSNPAL